MLTRQTVTAASRVMLPTYAVFTFLYGLGFVLDIGGRLETTPALSFANTIMPFWMWGIVGIVTSGVMVFALWFKERFLFIFALYFCGSYYAVWTIVFAVAIFTDAQASVTAPLYPAFVALACHASATSLERREEDR